MQWEFKDNNIPS